MTTGKLRSEAEFLEDLPDTKDLLRSCEEHKSVRIKSGRPAPPPARTASGGRMNWAQKRHEAKEGLRAEIIAALGGECVICGAAEERMCLSVPPRMWSGLDMPDKLRRLRHLRDNLGYVTLTCVAHLPGAGLSNPSTLTNRELVHKAYGGQCGACGATERLGVVAGPGVVPPRWPSGARYSSREKLAWLVRQRFPHGWQLRCDQHYSA